MRNVGWYLITLASLLCTGTAHAECTRPRPNFQIPEGASASEPDLTNAKVALQGFDDEVGKYLRCLEGEASQKSVGKDAAGRTKVRSDFVSSFNAAADELTGLGECYNAQVAAAKPPKATSTKKTANCSEFIKQAGTRKINARDDSVQTGFVKEADGYTTELPDGAWSFTLIRDERVRRCGTVECLQRLVFIRNSSPRALECTASISYTGPDIEGKTTREGKAVVSGKAARPIVTSLAPRGVDASTFLAECKPRSELPPLATPATCKYEVIKPITIGDYYPDASRKAGEEGPVTVEFNVGNKAASPTDVKVVASSLIPALDQGAVNAVQAMVMSSNCASGRYRLRLSFQLQ
jgi:TonB family protein